MKRMEHAPARDAGTVTMATVMVGGQPMLEVVVHAAVLRTLPWYRGGVGVTTMALPYGGGRLEIARAGLDAPYRLLARRGQALDKLPPVQLRMPALPGMDMAERAPEPVGYEAAGAVLALSLPVWARRAPQARALHAAGEVA